MKWGLAGVMLLLALPTMAKEGDTFRPFVSYTQNYDSNLFRLADDETAVVVENGVIVPVTIDSASDRYGVFGIGLDVDWKQGRQQVVGSLSKSLVRYSRYSSLDYDGEEYRGTWNWRLGNHWSGQLGASQTVTQTSFSDFQSFNVNGTPVFLAATNLVTSDVQFGSAEWEFHPRWRIGGSVTLTDSDNSRLQRRSQDYEEDSEYVYLTYLTPKGSRLRGEIRHLDAVYPNQQFILGSSLIDNSFTQDELNFVGDWSVSGKLLNHLRLGYVKRQFANPLSGDASWVAGRYSADYFPTGKTSLTLGIYREPAPTGDANASFRVNTGVNLNAAWKLTDKITAQGGAKYESATYDLIVAGVPQRVDDTLNGYLSLSYAPARMATINLGLQAGSRDSTVSVDEYEFHSVFVGVQADF